MKLTTIPGGLAVAVISAVSFGTSGALVKPLLEAGWSPAAAVTVRADAPWKTIEEFLAATKAKNGAMTMGNSGPGSIWHLAAASIEEKTNVKFNHVGFGGAAPAVLSLLGGHIDAVAVSPGEVATHVQGGKLRTLAVASDKRVKGFETVPTFKERNLNVSIGTWRGLAAPKGTPADVMAVLSEVARKCADEPAFKDGLDRLSMGWSYGNAETFRANMKRDNDYFKELVGKLGLKTA